MENNTKLRILVITNLFPNHKESNKGVFMKQALLEMVKLSYLEVIAPVPWFPRILKSFSYRGLNSDILREEAVDGIKTYHPRWLVIPKIGRVLYGFYFFLSILPLCKRIQRKSNFDVIYSPWVYPDGFASVLIAKVLKRPVILHALGCDVNQYTKFFLRRQLIKWSLRHADLVISVSHAIRIKMLGLGVPEGKIRVIANGIDKNLFKPLNQQECRKKTGLDINEKIILFVGSLEAVKGIEFLISSFHLLKQKYAKNVKLVIIGKGSLEDEIKKQIEYLELQKNIMMVGEVKHDNIPNWMNASDVFCLPSIREGMPNVILEALACGKTVVATTVGGIPEIITDPKLGVLVPPESAEYLCNAFIDILNFPVSNITRCQHKSVISWAEHAKLLLSQIQSTCLKQD